MIDFELEEDERLLQESVRAFAVRELRPRLREFEKAGGVDERTRKAYEELGLPLLTVPAEAGGAGLSWRAAAVVHEELAWADAGAAVALARAFPASEAVWALGDDAQRKAWIGRLARAGATGAVAFSEPAPAPEGRLFLTLAHRDGDGFVLEGRKLGVIRPEADVLVVFASVDGEGGGWAGAGAFVVERGAPGLLPGRPQRTVGLGAAPIGEVTFSGCRVPADRRLGGRGDLAGAARAFLLRYALVNAARQVGLARASFDHARRYAEERQAFGKPIAHFEEIAFRLADMHMDVESARWMVWRAAAELDAAAPSAPTSIAKAAAHAADAAWRVTDWSVQILGGAGYMRDHPCEKWMRDTKALALCGPPAEALLVAVAAAELGEPEPDLLHPHLQPGLT